MDIWFVTPCFGRLEVTTLALTQRAELASDLAALGVTARTVIVADDENLDIGLEFGCEVVEQKNRLGLKVNDGFEYAYQHGAGYAAFVGSDDWVHIDLLEPLIQGEWSRVISGHIVSIVDLARGRLRKLGVRGFRGVSPWFIPRRMMAGCGFRPVPDDLDSGMEGAIASAIPSADWTMHDPHEFCRVDFKTDNNMTEYGNIARNLGYGRELDAWDALGLHYSESLIDLGRKTQALYAPRPVAA